MGIEYRSLQDFVFSRERRSVLLEDLEIEGLMVA